MEADLYFGALGYLGSFLVPLVVILLCTFDA